jgi:sugar phosphate isomerase/epimerase
MDIGYTEVETSRADLHKVKPICDKYGLKVPSAHFETGFVNGNRKAWNVPEGMTWQQAVDDAKQYGLSYVLVAYVQPAERGKTLDEWRTFCKQLNDAGAVVKKAGMQFGYHHHAFEFEGEPGKRRIDVFFETTDQDLVKLESDVFWAGAAGQNPAEFISEHGDRIALLHLKDKRAGMPVIYIEGMARPRDFQEVGNGSLDFPAILRAADKAGIQDYFVEQDATPGDPVESLRTSYRNLRALEL